LRIGIIPKQINPTLRTIPKKANHDNVKFLGPNPGNRIVPKQVKPARGFNIQVEAKSFLLFGLLNSQNIKEYDNHE
jgi:hypothetical protein